MTRVLHRHARPFVGAAFLILGGCTIGNGRAVESTAPIGPGEIEVFSGFGPRDGSIYSVVRADDGEEVEHGLRVTTDHGWLREAMVHDHGVLIRHFQFHRSGHPFIMRSIEKSGDGFVQIWNTEAQVVFNGHVRAGQRWRGEFMVPVFIPNTYGQRRIMLYEYEDGEVVRSAPFPFERVGVDPPDDSIDPRNWPWVWTDWPSPTFMSGPAVKE